MAHEHNHGHEHTHEHGHDHGHEHAHTHGHEHEHESDNRLILIVRMLAAALLIIFGLFLIDDPVFEYLIFGAAYIMIGYDVVLEAFENITHGEIFDETFLMVIASLGAFIIGEQAEGAAVMLLFQIGEMLEDLASDRARDRITALCNVRPDSANVITPEGIEERHAEDVNVGEIMLIKAGERVPLDGTIIEGVTEFDCSCLTGESMPIAKKAGDTALSGCVNLRGVIKVRAEKEYSQSQAARILELVEEAADNKSQSEQFITKFARVYTPAVCIIAVILAVFGSLFSGDVLTWIYRSLMFLVISCPCALVISVPLSFFSGMGALSKAGVLVKGSAYIDALSHAKITVFDKTGTLTTGSFSVTGECDADLLKIAAHLEKNSNHPLAKAIVKAYEGGFDDRLVTEMTEIAGMGVAAKYNGVPTLVGNAALMLENGIEFTEERGAVVYAAQNGELIGAIRLSDESRKEAGEQLEELRSLGVNRQVMLTGDNRFAAELTAQALGLDEYRAELLPKDKLICVEELLEERPENGRLLFVGDGINDAPALALADVGIAMGALGADAAIEAADVALMEDGLGKLSTAVRHSRRILLIVWENIAFSIGVKLLVMLLSALGAGSMWLAILADVGVCLIAIANSLRAMQIAK